MTAPSIKLLFAPPGPGGKTDWRWRANTSRGSLASETRLGISRPCIEQMDKKVWVDRQRRIISRLGMFITRINKDLLSAGTGSTKLASLLETSPPPTKPPARLYWREEEKNNNNKKTALYVRRRVFLRDSSGSGLPVPGGPLPRTQREVSGGRRGWEVAGGERGRSLASHNPTCPCTIQTVNPFN